MLSGVRLPWFLVSWWGWAAVLIGGRMGRQNRRGRVRVGLFPWRWRCCFQSAEEGVRHGCESSAAAAEDRAQVSLLPHYIPGRFSYKSHFCAFPEHINYLCHVRCCIPPIDARVLRNAYKYPLVACAISSKEERCM